jgi:hypothetical protein
MPFPSEPDLDPWPNLCGRYPHAVQGGGSACAGLTPSPLNLIACSRD